MRFSVFSATALLAYTAKAQLNEKDIQQREKKIEHPPFKAIWKPSNAIKSGTDGEFSYVGKWSVEESIVFPGLKGDKGLVVKSPAAHHAISAILPEPLDNKGKTLVVQYEVKFQNPHECGGAYIKLLSDNDELRSEEFSNESPYQVMFGPDKCGSTNKIHFIIRRKNPITGDYEEKHLKNPPPALLNRSTNLYTLVIKENQDFEIRVNGKIIRAANLLDENIMFPSINPPKEIDDKDDIKPSDWVDDISIPDLSQANKPEDWDEDEPAQIPDPDVTKPEDWKEDVDEYIPDPEVEIPEDWDAEEDGEFVPPEIPNPECELHGCGPWTAPLIRNPKYKGKWVQPMIANPDYKGPWSPRKIPNPNYYEDATPSDLEPIGAIGIELWTMQNDILFDNFYLGHSIQEAEEIGNATFVPKNVIENAQEEEEMKLMEKKRHRGYNTWIDHFINDPADFIFEFSRFFIINFKASPIEFILNQPLVFLAVVAALTLVSTVLLGLIAILYVLVKPSSDKPAEKTKSVSTEQKESVSTEQKEASAKSSATKKNATISKRTRFAD
ncbi:hypothetical protein D0Z00_003245 [Geotrichum galactomycetum]|uniref:Uncharacterized protein n=1 Tax=Geotrichum galactomycetum TaxID=27317 RepID=A0ACB6V1U8_9ASCO|nr:hypothetical protein D0Z00_003245 [Geotrichum candidum]